MKRDRVMLLYDRMVEEVSLLVGGVGSGLCV